MVVCNSIAESKPEYLTEKQGKAAVITSLKKIDLNLHREKQELLFTFMHDYPHK
jgi:hypothetical protein